MEGSQLGHHVSQRGAFPGLDENDRVLITGATGWLGTELIARLADSRPEIPLFAVASRHRSFNAGRHRLVALPWDEDAIAKWKPTFMVHLAYLTREKEAQMGSDEYILRNRSISSAAVRLMDLPSLRGAVVASSGAAVTLTGEAYGQLKAEDEARFAELGRQRALPIVVARTWSVSGALCPKPEHFALYDLMRQAASADAIRIHAKREVWRRYVDAGEYLEVCVGAAAAGMSGIVDSAGPLVELGELADAIQAAFAADKPVFRADPRGTADRYHTNSETMASLAKQLNIGISDLENQVLRSRHALGAVGS